VPSSSVEPGEPLDIACSTSAGVPVNPSVRVIVLQRSDHQPAQLGPWRYWVWCNAHRTPLRVKGLGRSDTPTSLGGRRTRAPRRHKREPSTRSAVSSMLVLGKCRTVRDPWRAGGTSPAVVVRSCCYPSGRGREVRRTPGAKPFHCADHRRRPWARLPQALAQWESLILEGTLLTSR